MKKYERIFVIVLDSLGIGAMPDSEKFGDVGVDTFGHILDKMGSLEIPNLKKLGMLNLHPAGNMQGVEKPIGRYMRVGEASNGKDTMTGHWEMMGIKTEKPFKTFTHTGFPPELIAELEKRCGKRVIGNSPEHIHILVSIPPSISVAQFMGYLKGKSALMIFDKHVNLKYKFGNSVPEKNRPDIEEMDREIIQGLDIRFVDNMKEVLGEALA